MSHSINPAEVFLPLKRGEVAHSAGGGSQPTEVSLPLKRGEVPPQGAEGGLQRAEGGLHITIYCASSSKLRPSYVEAASELGRLIAQRGHTLINGAGTMGLMGASTDACIAAGGKTIGIIPQFMVDEGWEHRGMDQLIVTQDMHERKARLTEMADAIVVLPGGLGTLDELFDAVTLKQLGVFLKPIIILNTDGFYDHLLEHIQYAMDEQMLRIEHADAWCVARTPEEALNLCETTPLFRSDIRKIAKI